MKVLKIATGILSIGMSLLVLLQSVFTDLVISITHDGQSPGLAGIVVALMLLAGGIVSIAASEGSMEADAGLMSVYGVGALVSFSLTGNVLWAAWCLLCAVLALGDCVVLYRTEEDSPESGDAGDTDTGGDGENGAQADEGTAAEPEEEPEPPAEERVEVLSLWELVQVKEPRRRDLCIDVLPEQEAKSYLKQVISDVIERQSTASAHPGPSPHEAPSTKPKSGRRQALLPLILVAGGILIVGAVLGAIIFWAIWGRDGGQPEAPPPSGAVSTQEVTQEPTPEPTQEPTPEPTVQPTQAAADRPPVATGALGDYSVAIQSAFLTEDHDGAPAIVITYTWTNHSEKTTNAMMAFVEEAFQDGVQLDPATVLPQSGYDSGSFLRDLRPGASTDVQRAYVLDSGTSPVEFEVTEFTSLSTGSVSALFRPAELSTEE